MRFFILPPSEFIIRFCIVLATAVLEEENQVDGFRDEVFRKLLGQMQTDPTIAQRAMSLIFFSRNLERVADHATNIAEEVIYWIQGRDIRHGKAGLESA